MMYWSFLSIISILSASVLSLANVSVPFQQELFSEDRREVEALSTAVRDTESGEKEVNNEESTALQESRASIIGSAVAALTGLWTGDVIDISAKILFLIAAYIFVNILVNIIIGIIGFIVNFNVIVYVIFPVIIDMLENMIQLN